MLLLQKIIRGFTKLFSSIRNPLYDLNTGKPNTNSGNWYLDWTRETCSIATALKESFLITTFKTPFSFTVYFSFFHMSGDWGTHTSLISISLFCKWIHFIVFHFNAHLIYFSSRIHNSLLRRAAYQTKETHRQQKPSLVTHHRSLLVLLCCHLVFFCLVSPPGWREHICI